MSRWRLGLAITLTIVAIPLWIQAGEPDAAAGPEKVDAPGDPNARGYALLADRATAWSNLRDSVVDAQAQEARAAEEAAAAAAAAATTTTTTVPRTTRAPTTTAKPTTTVATTRATTTTRAPTTTAKPTTTVAAKAPTTTVKPVTTVPTTKAPTTTAVPAPPAGPPRALPGGTTPEMWLQLRMCESGNNYRASSSGGMYHGAYQFAQSTWNTIAASTPSLTRLIGVDPATAAPVDQDSMAYTLYEMRGKAPWPLCGAQLP